MSVNKKRIATRASGAIIALAWLFCLVYIWLVVTGIVRVDGFVPYKG